MSRSSTFHVAVIGTGIVGACCALRLLEEGHHVTMIEAGPPGGEQAASYGNGAWLSPSSVVPMSMPGLWRKIPAHLSDPEGPLHLHWSALPSLAPWLLRFLVAGNTVDKVARTAKALSALLHDAPQRHASIAASIGRPELIAQRGLLYPFPEPKDQDKEALAWRLREDNGIAWKSLSRERLAALVPELSSRYRHAALVESGGHCTNPGAYVAAVVQHCQKLGAELVTAQATGFALDRGRLSGVQTSNPATPFIACQRAVIAAGIASKTLANSLGDRVFLESERGYHVVFERPGFELDIPLMPSDAKMAMTSTLTGLRVSGQVELCKPGTPPNWARAELLRRYALAHFPSLQANPSFKLALDQEQGAPSGMTRWMGHRPSTPDGLPVLSASLACAQVIHAYGHGHVGLASGPASAQLIADLIAERQSAIDVKPYALSRFQ
jgi:D-amino-acid dehydrogenase